jgi:hypothetical protein
MSGENDWVIHIRSFWVWFRNYIASNNALLPSRKPSKDSLDASHECIIASRTGAQDINFIGTAMARRWQSMQSQCVATPRRSRKWLKECVTSLAHQSLGFVCPQKVYCWDWCLQERSYTDCWGQYFCHISLLPPFCLHDSSHLKLSIGSFILCMDRQLDEILSRS